MLLRIRCLNDACQIRFRAPLAPDAPAPVCPGCRRPHALHAPALEPGGFVRCPVCGGEELYVRKDFPQRAGLALVVVVAVLSFWLFARGDLLWALGVLAGVVLLDLLIYRAVPRITVCYRCRTEICNAPINPDHAGFDLATAEKYR